MWLLTYLHDKRFLSIAFANFYRKSRIKTKQKLSSSGDERYTNSLLNGHKSAMLYLWHSMLEKEKYAQHVRLFETIKDSRNWDQFDYYFGRLNKEILEPHRFQNDLEHLALRQTRKPPTALTRELVSVVSRTVERLPKFFSVFRGYPVKLISASDPNATAELEQTIVGSVLLSKERIEIVRFKHKLPPGYNYSYAVLVASHGSFGSDFSRWWLFHDFCTDYSGGGSLSYAIIEETINRFSDKIKLRTVGRFSSEDLMNFAEDSVTRHARERLRDEMADNARLRGNYLELLVSHILSRMGFECFVHTRVLFPAPTDIDVLAVKGRNAKEIIVAQCKERSKSSSESQYADQEISDFLILLEGIRHKPDKFLQQFRKVSKTTKVTGIFVLTKSLEHSLTTWRSKPYLELWDLEKLVEECKSHRIGKPIYEDAFKTVFPSISKDDLDKLFLTGLNSDISDPLDYFEKLDFEERLQDHQQIL